MGFPVILHKYGETITVFNTTALKSKLAEGYVYIKKEKEIINKSEDLSEVNNVIVDIIENTKVLPKSKKPKNKRLIKKILAK